MKDAEWRPPVVADLFSSRSLDGVLMNYPAAQTLMSSVRTEVRSGQPFERAIRSHVENSNPYIQRQVKELPIALQQFFFRVSHNYTTEAINYSHLVNRTVGQGIQTAFITLNYDTLLEKSLTKIVGESFGARDSYIGSADWLLVKLHGSVDWGYEWASTVSSALEAVRQFEPPNRRSELIQVGLDLNLRKENAVYYPAMVLPVEGKYDLVCPTEHITRLREFLSNCSAYLFIGCSGSDEDLFDFLTETCGRVFLAGLVTGESDHNDVVRRFKAKMPNAIASPLGQDKYIFARGFTKFLEQKLDGFLADLKQYLGPR